MSRKHRAWYQGAMYHIASRGNRRSELFYNDIDRKAYLEILEETRFFHPFYIHACLMTNHIHLQLEATTHRIRHIMKRLNTKYALHFNKHHKLVGHVFQGRYGSGYIYLNPVEAVTGLM